MHRIILFFFILFFGLLAGCVPTYETHGYIPEKQSIKQLKTGMDKEAVRALMGVPTVTSYVDGQDWYYMWTKHKLETYHAPELVDQFIITVTFDAKNKLQRVKFTDINDTHTVSFSSDQTLIYGRQTGAFEQFLAGSILNNRK